MLRNQHEKSKGYECERNYLRIPNGRSPRLVGKVTVREALSRVEFYTWCANYVFIQPAAVRTLDVIIKDLFFIHTNCGPWFRAISTNTFRSLKNNACLLTISWLLFMRIALNLPNVCLYFEQCVIWGNIH